MAATRGRPSRETIFERFAAASAELDQFGGLPTPAEAGGIWDDLWHLESHNSTAIEGNTLVLREVAQLLEDGKAVGAKPLKDYLEVRGYGDAAQWVYAQAHGADLLELATTQRARASLRRARDWAVDVHLGADRGALAGPARRPDARDRQRDRSAAGGR
jgi:hypothetical protein